MMTRAFVAWVLLLVLAVLNGILRQALVVPRVGQTAAHVISTLALSAAIVAATWLVIPWIAPVTPRDAWNVGSLWVILTVAFEFLGGHYLFGQPWNRLVEDYKIGEGRIWILVLIAAFLAPRLMAGSRGLVR